MVLRRVLVVKVSDKAYVEGVSSFFPDPVPLFPHSAREMVAPHHTPASTATAVGGNVPITVPVHL